MFWRHLRQDFAERLIAASGDVFVNVLGIDEAAIAQDDAQLLAIEGDIVIEGDCLMGDGLFVRQPLNNTALDERLLHQFLYIGRLNLTVENPFGVNDHHRSHGTKATTAGSHYAHFCIQTASRDLGPQGVNNRDRA